MRELALARVARQMCNYRRLGVQVGLDGETTLRYVSAIEPMDLLRRVEPWSGNHLSRWVGTPEF